MPHSLRTPLYLPSRLVAIPKRCRSGTNCCSSNSHFFRLYAGKESDEDSDRGKDDEQSKGKSDEELFSDALDTKMYTLGELASTSTEPSETKEHSKDVDDEQEDPYVTRAEIEFVQDESEMDRTIVAKSLESALTLAQPLGTSRVDWDNAMNTLSQRKTDIEEGLSDDPSYAIFRFIAKDRPNEAIGQFVKETNPEIVAAMSSAVSSLLGSLSNPAMGIETVVSASSERLGQLCFQLMMTGYMFRNAEYVIALKQLMNIKADATLQEYKAAFKKLDTDNSGYLEWEEVEEMLKDVYEGEPPEFEVATFMEFFDKNGDGKISWEEFEKGFGGMKQSGSRGEYDPDSVWSNVGRALPASNQDEDDEDDEEELVPEGKVSGMIKVALDDGRIIEVDAQEYIDDLKQQAIELKRELAIQMGEEQPTTKGPDANLIVGDQSKNPVGGIARYISSLQGDLKPLTQGISPEVMEAMKMLINFVLEGPASANADVTRDEDAKKKEMELPGSALQQLALWQLVNGYRLRETEAKGDWRKMME